jgi:hypothetical protein
VNIFELNPKMSSLTALKKAECQPVKIPGKDELPHQQMTAMSREFMP